jgi:hypothetical protein
MATIEVTIEHLKGKLDILIENRNYCLLDAEIISLSQTLDELIYKYYSASSI